MMCRPLSIVLTLGAIAAPACAAEFLVKNEAEFNKLVPEGAKLQKLATGFKFLEGSCWTDANGGYLIFSDIPNNRLVKWTKKDGISTFRTDSHGGNGNTWDNEGCLITCEEGGRTITRTKPKDGAFTAAVTLAEKYDGKRFNSPNDVAVKSDGSVWFTDPPYGLGTGKKEQDGNYVFRLDPKTMAPAIVAKDFDRPNGLCFSPDQKKLYIADSGKPHHIRVFDVKDDGTLAGGSVFCVIDKGGPDGIRCDADGRLWSSAGDGVHIFSPTGELIGKILVPEGPSNLCFSGGEKTLFITARTSLYAIKVSVVGAVDVKGR